MMVCLPAQKLCHLTLVYTLATLSSDDQQGGTFVPPYILLSGEWLKYVARGAKGILPLYGLLMARAEIPRVEETAALAR